MLQESTRRYSVRAGAEITTVVSVKHGVMSKAVVKRPVEDRSLLEIQMVHSLSLAVFSW